MTITITRTSFLALTILFFFFFFLLLGFGQSSITGIQLTYKLDPRVVDSYRGIGPWATGPNFSGAYAQDTVEIRAEGVNAAGKPLKISPQWVPSDPEMVTVSPSQGDQVKITVHRAGESKLEITYQGFSMELVVSAKYVREGKLMSLEIGQSPATKPDAPAVTEAPPARKSKNDVSYAAGMNLAKALEEQAVGVDVDSLVQGIKDKLSGGLTRMTEEQAVATLEGLQTDHRIVQVNLTRKALGEKNKREGEAFLAANKSKEGVVTLPSGLQYKILKAGEGKKPTADDIVNVQYRASFVNGREFDNSSQRHSSVSFPVRAVIKSWQEALQLMPTGSKWQLFVPPDLAYGELGAGGGAGRRKGPAQQIIGPNATLIFELELISIKEGPGPGESVTTNAESGQARPAGEKKQ